MQDRLVIDEETGVVLTTIHDGDRIVRAKSVEHLDTYDTWDLSGFFKGHSAELKQVIPTLNMAEKAVLMSIIPYVSYSACNLEYSNVVGYSNGKDINLDDIVSICGFSKNTVTSAVNSLIKKDILYKGRNSNGNQYFINPWLVHKGNTINKVLKEMFKNYHIRVKQNVKWKDL